MSQLMQYISKIKHLLVIVSIISWPLAQHVSSVTTNCYLYIHVCLFLVPK